MADVEAVGLGAKCKVVVNRCERCWLCSLLQAKLDFCGSLHQQLARPGALEGDHLTQHSLTSSGSLPARPCSLVKLGRAQLKVAAQGTLYLLT